MRRSFLWALTVKAIGVDANGFSSHLAAHDTSSAQSITESTAILEAMLTAHANYPFQSGPQSACIDYDGFLRAITLLTDRGQRILKRRGHTWRPEIGKQITLRGRSKQDREQFLFLALAEPHADLTAAPAEDSETAEMRDVLDALSNVSDLHPGKHGAKGPPLTRQDLVPSAKKLLEQVGTPSKPSFISAKTFRVFDDLIMSIKDKKEGDDAHTTDRMSTNEGVSLEEFYRYAAEVN